MSDFEYFKPYEGDKPYIFISYAHADDDAVLPIVSDMHRRGYNIWYDEGIEVGSEWQECIASHLADAHLVVAFISNAYMRSDNCRREMHYAQSKKIKTINIFVEETALTPGMELQIGNIFALMKYTYPSDEYFYDKLYSAPLLNSENFADASPRPTTETAKSVPVLPKKEKKEKKKSQVDEAVELVFQDMENRMKTVMGTKVNISRKDKSKGKIEIEYYSEAELERHGELIESIQPV